MWDDPCGETDCGSGTGTSVPVALVVTDVPVSPSSVVAEVCDGFSFGSDWEFVEPQLFSFSKKGWIVLEENQGEMSYEGTPVKAPPTPRRRMMPPSPEQISFSSKDKSQWQADLKAQRSI